MPLLPPIRYGTQQPIALLKLLLELGGMYDRGKDLSWKKLKDLGFVAAMAPPGGARNPVDPRFVALFAVFNINFPSDDSLRRIYDSILSTHLAGWSAQGDSAVVDMAQSVTQATMALYQYIVVKMPPTPAKFHYIFNLRDLSRVYEGVCTSTPDKMPSRTHIARLWRNECLRMLLGETWNLEVSPEQFFF